MSVVLISHILLFCNCFPNYGDEKSLYYFHLVFCFIFGCYLAPGRFAVIPVGETTDCERRIKRFW